MDEAALRTGGAGGIRGERSDNLEKEVEGEPWPSSARRGFEDDPVEEDDEEGVDGELKRRRDRERGQEGDLDEMEYEEDFADDDDKMEPEGINDEETKEIEVCAVSLQRRR